MTTTQTTDQVIKGECGVQSHWTVIHDGEQVACRTTKRDALAAIRTS